ncbi:hypothetical protein PM082_022070 [Marasmius tenuissimus]|nr:hypothetical protein PM082_022070 [Marasmius tenuissimus]
MFRHSLGDIEELATASTGDSELNPVVLEGVDKEDFRRFLDVLYPRFCPAVPYESLSVHSWLSVVKLSTLWNFLPVKELAIDILGRREPPDSLSDFDLIVIAREFGLPTWFQAGCEGIGKDFDEDIDIETDGVKVGMETSVRLYQLKNKMRRMIGTCKDGASQDRFLRDAFLSLFGQEVKELERKRKGDH